MTWQPLAIGALLLASSAAIGAQTPTFRARWVTDQSARIGPLLLEALADMRARYLVTYYPDPPAAAGWHDLKVTLKTGRADILTRPGYLVP